LPDGFEAEAMAVSLFNDGLCPFQRLCSLHCKVLEQWIVFGWQVPILAAPDLDFADQSPCISKWEADNPAWPLPWPSCGSLTAMRGDSPVGLAENYIDQLCLNNCWI